jgi:GNAT superfamily N-acetyltransferase
MNISIRQAGINDANVIANLSFQLGYTISESETISNIQWLSKSQNDVIYIAAVEDVVVGWIHVLYARRVESKPFCEIAGLVVEENVRRKGIGKLLIEKAISWSRQTSAETLRVRTNIIRTETHKFYERAGFTLGKQQKVYQIPIT